MSIELKYYSISTIEKLQPTGDASKFLIDYSIADDEIGTSNRLDKSIIVRLSRNVEMNASLDNDDDKAKAVLGYIHNLIEAAILKKDELPAEITITSYDKNFPSINDELGIALGQWNEVAIETRMGFLE